MSFKGVCTYVLNDADKKKTSDRVLWTDTHNLNASPGEAWREMHATWQDRVRLKRTAGVDLRGRDNTKPVLHMTLSWHPDDRPTPDHMKEASLSALKAIGLDGHQVLMAAHDDKKHLHMHLIINTVDPATGRTAPMKYTKERLSRWAEAYEKEYGLRIEQRVENNERRDKLKAQRERNATEILMAGEQGKVPPEAMPYVPVKGRSPNRTEWMARQDIIAQMTAMRERHEQPYSRDRSVLASKHKQQHDDIWQSMKAATEQVREHVSSEYRPRWRELFQKQRKEVAYLENAVVDQTVRRGSIKTTKRNRGRNILERALFVYQNRDRLGYHLPLSPKEMTELIANPDKLMKRVLARQDDDRRFLGRLQRRRANELGDVIKQQHRTRIENLAAQHRAERQELADQHKTAVDDHASFAQAKEELASQAQASPEPAPPRPFKRGPANERMSDTFAKVAENPTPPAARQFKQAAASEKLSRAEQIRRDMEAWRKRNDGKDFGREL